MSDYCNKLGLEVKVGQVWRDCDKRMRNRHVRVVGLSTKHGEAAAEVLPCRASNGQLVGPATPTRILVRRMHPHSTGWAFAGEVRS